MISSNPNIARASDALLLLSHSVNFEPILSTSEAWAVVVESKRQHGTIYIDQMNNRQELVLARKDLVMVSLYGCDLPECESIYRM